ncbi:MAG: hypothetical protein JSU68_12220 [Phycisphaerales bacterium]|nr:MAG: hypothetical protein JSU68_12220 [Phycisphaerales bacterium]
MFRIAGWPYRRARTSDWAASARGALELDSGSRVGVIGGGPAGSFFSYFLLEMAERMGIELKVDIYESRDFGSPGPANCNHCGGIVSESLVQMLATEGILLPTEVVQRGIDSYVLHMDVGDVRIETPLHEKRIAAVHRGSGPRGVTAVKWHSFDKFLLDLAVKSGARHLRERVRSVSWSEGRPRISTKAGEPKSYDLMVAAMGVNSGGLKLLDELGIECEPPKTTTTHISEFFLKPEVVERYLGSAMHVFLLHIPNLEFAALIPKGSHVTLVMLGREINKELIQSFLDSPEVNRCLPQECRGEHRVCSCSPRINIRGAVRPFADRVVFVGDCGMTRLYKDGIGAAYRTAKAAATAAIFDGVSAEAFRRHYWPTCRAIGADNRIGKLIFAATQTMMKLRPARRGVLRMVSGEQCKPPERRRMSTVLWDVFTGSAPYKEVLLRTMRPGFVPHLLWDMALATRPTAKADA